MGIYGDVRLAVRNLRATPSYAVASILTLALAIAATSAIFSAVYGILLRPLPIRDPSDLVVGWERDAARGTRVVEVTYNQYMSTYATVVAVVCTAVVAASSLPALRAAATNPIEILRRE